MLQHPNITTKQHPIQPRFEDDAEDDVPPMQEEAV